MNKLALLLFLIFAGITGFQLKALANPDFDNLTPTQMLQTITKQRRSAIQKAVEAGDYNCCINPPCTMCYLEANQWNNQTPGTCACDDLIAQGKEPCPQCQNNLCKKNNQGACLPNQD